ncbi:glycosyl hydrolase [Galliscardovia ingluviei]|uniref:Exo-alpha-(1->6)-L-arabinopyranosidase n=1 Tax=Galliscardovia ingluviei TaxID=1769422 RepID=A0A8J3AIG1_9BIFI|nr:exo-alpha-(1->6)-L-arabinopyranosidase [Galliscardovia ingluviei]GGI15087.1 glycosyl hydrolase [Galliscardovia ingluviei]
MSEQYPSAQDPTLEEQASLTSGQDAWHLQGIPEKGIPGYMITDGPHGLRKALASTTATNLNDSVPATCFPPAAGMSSTWNPQLIHQVGVAMGEECIQEQVAVILGPGVNIKRNPLGGRSFEYWSEDPYLAGHEAVGIVSGVQSQGIGTSLKHFAANNQETDRLRISARISQRALREIYFPAFEHIVKTAQPWTIMCSYNQINGVHSAQNRWLLTDVLRGEWGFKGIVMSDWGADHDRVASLNAGLNLEMPPSGTDNQIVYAAQDGRIDRKQLAAMAQGMIDLVNQTRQAMSREGYTFDANAHHQLARQAAAESVVLLKNDDNILPLAPTANIAIIGEFARTPRYQGGGSSHITPTRMSSLIDALQERGANAQFAPGFTLEDEPQDAALTQEAVTTAQHADVVVMCIGLPEYAESEGFDRTTLDIPAKQLAVLDAVAQVNSNIVVILSNGSVVSMEPWQQHAKAVLEAWLLGQAGGAALADLLYGDANPSGKLAQTIINDINDDPSMLNWPGEEGHVDYGEGVFVGYRYYDTFKRQVAYPFGYGLSYSTFAIDQVQAVADAYQPNTVQVSARVTNTSDRAGAEVLQVYVAPEQSAVARPVHELKGFAKVYLEAGASTTVTIELDSRAFAYWSERFNDWHVEEGTYTVEVGTSSRDIAARVAVTLEGDHKTLPLTEWSTYDEWKQDILGAQAMKAAEEAAERGEIIAIPDNDMTALFLHAMPINSMTTLLGPEGGKITQFLLDWYEAHTK